MSFLYSVNERHYKNVAASTTDTFDYTPANGEELFVANAGLSSSSSPDTSVCLVWDALGTPQILMSTYNEAFHHDINLTFIGDGTKVMRLCLTNDLTEPTYLGGFWQAMIL